MKLDEPIITGPSTSNICISHLLQQQSQNGLRQWTAGFSDGFQFICRFRLEFFFVRGRFVFFAGLALERVCGQNVVNKQL
ncbi:MAG: hypothetical protein ACLT29_09195 [Ruminococcus callidus]